MNLNTVTTPHADAASSARLSPKKPRTRYTEFADAHRACGTSVEREQLAAVIRDGWSEDELREFARRYFFPNNKDYPTALSYRRAVTSIAENYKPLSWRSTDYGRVSWRSEARAWLKQYRKDGSKPLPPRREGLLKRGRGNGPRVTSAEYAWPGHTEEYRSMIEQRCRDYFKIAEEEPVHVNAWAASQRAYERERDDDAKAAQPSASSVTISAIGRCAPSSQLRAPGGA